MPRRTDEQVRSEHQIAHEDPEATSDGRIFCTCSWASPIAPRAKRMELLARHVEHEVNAEEWCWGDQEKARKRYQEIEAGRLRVPYGPGRPNICRDPDGFPDIRRTLAESYCFRVTAEQAETILGGAA